MGLPIKELNRAKVGLMTHKGAVFITSIVFSLKIKWDPDCAPDGGSVGYTDGRHIGIQPTNFLALTEQQRVWFLAHEAWHVALRHLLRMKGKKHQLWNLACDYVINIMLLDAGFMLPAGRPCEPEYRGMSSDEVYASLLQEAEEDLPEPDDDMREPGQGEEGEGQHQSGLEQHIDQMVIRAQVQHQEAQRLSNEPGSLPGELELMVGQLLTPSIPWQEYLARFVTRYRKTRYSMMHPKMVYLPQYHIPSLRGKGLGKIAAAVDTSGSAHHMLTPFVTELRHLYTTMNPESLAVVDFDTQINHVHELGFQHDFNNLSFTGGGGTAIQPVLDWAKEHKPEVLIVFTDGEFYLPPEDPGIPILWLIYDNNRFNPPYGEVVMLPAPT
jgi:predicted metal-dependent peptidase